MNPKNDQKNPLNIKNHEAIYLLARSHAGLKSDYLFLCALGLSEIQLLYEFDLKYICN